MIPNFDSLYRNSGVKSISFRLPAPIRQSELEVIAITGSCRFRIEVYESPTIFRWVETEIYEILRRDNERAYADREAWFDEFLAPHWRGSLIWASRYGFAPAPVSRKLNVSRWFLTSIEATGWFSDSYERDSLYLEGFLREDPLTFKLPRFAAA